MRDLTDAQHEAAHVVVGVALGLRLSRVWLGRDRRGTFGFTEWEPKPFWREADLIMTAAGVAWERRVGEIEWAGDDLRHLRKCGVRGNLQLTALERAAWAILESRPGIHARVTRALLEGDLDHKSVRALWAEKERF
jgi:hypothetical protein